MIWNRNPKKKEKPKPKKTKYKPRAKYKVEIMLKNGKLFLDNNRMGLSLKEAIKEVNQFDKCKKKRIKIHNGFIEMKEIVAVFYIKVN